MSELNRVFAGTVFSINSSEPALLTCFSGLTCAALLGVGLGMAGYAKVVRKYGNVWLLGAFLPVGIYTSFSHRMHSEKTQNAYR